MPNTVRQARRHKQRQRDRLFDDCEKWAPHTGETHELRTRKEPGEIVLVNALYPALRKTETGYEEIG